MDIFEEIVQARKNNQPVVVATVIQTVGSTPRREGARMLVRSNGTTAGTIGGGAVEQKVIKECREVMISGAARVVTCQQDDAGTACGGSMSLFIEPLVPAPQLVIFGAGHIGICLAQIGKMLDFTVTVVDSRSEVANAERLPWADTIIAKDYGAAIETVMYTDNSYIVILTHKHDYDFEVLEKCLNKKYCYIGMIGSRAKVAAMLQKLRGNGVPDAIIEQIHSPIGLKIGGTTPAEIAIAILAEIIQVRNATGAGTEQAACCNPRV